MKLKLSQQFSLLPSRGASRLLCLINLWLLVLTSCGPRNEKVGGETNFLTACEVDTDCGVGACFCGLCATSPSASAGMVTPDPVELLLQPGSEGKDAEIADHPDYVSFDFADRASLLVAAWTRNGYSNDFRALLEFDYSALPQQAALQSARLSLFADTTQDAFGRGIGHVQDESSNAFYIQRVVESWDEVSVRWQNQPAVTTEHQVAEPASTSALENFTDIDVTQLVSDARVSTEGNHGFLIRIQIEEPYRGLSFASGDHPDGSLHPRLVLRYSLP